MLYPCPKLSTNTAYRCASTSTIDQCIEKNWRSHLEVERGSDIEFVAIVSPCFSRHAKHVFLVQLAGSTEDNVMQLLLEYSLRRDVDLHTYMTISFHNPSNNGVVPSPTPEVTGHTDLLLQIEST